MRSGSCTRQIRRVTGRCCRRTAENRQKTSRVNHVRKILAKIFAPPRRSERERGGIFSRLTPLAPHARSWCSATSLTVQEWKQRNVLPVVCVRVDSEQKQGLSKPISRAQRCETRASSAMGRRKTTRVRVLMPDCCARSVSNNPGSAWQEKMNPAAVVCIRIHQSSRSRSHRRSATRPPKERLEFSFRTCGCAAAFTRSLRGDRASGVRETRMPPRYVSSFACSRKKRELERPAVAFQNDNNNNNSGSLVFREKNGVTKRQRHQQMEGEKFFVTPQSRAPPPPKIQNHPILFILHPIFSPRDNGGNGHSHPERKLPRSKSTRKVSPGGRER